MLGLKTTNNDDEKRVSRDTAIDVNFVLATLKIKNEEFENNK